MIKKKNVYSLMALIFLIITAIFVYLFYTNTQVTTFQNLANPKNSPPKFSRMIYGGFGEDALDKPMDTALVGQFIYITDTNNKRVQVFDLAGGFLFKFGKEGEGKGEFKFPYGISGDSKGNVYVADLYNGSISVFDAKGKFIKYFAEKDPKEKLIEAPGGLRIYGNYLYVTDIMKCTVTVFSLEGTKVLEIGKPGKKDGELSAPNAVTVDKDGNIYVVDTGNQRFQVFDKTGKFLRKINGTPGGTGNSVFVNPRGIGIDSRGITYVVSNVTHFVHAFDQEGKQLFTFGGSGEGNTQFSLPNGLFIDENDNIYITDTTNQRVAVYGL